MTVKTILLISIIGLFISCQINETKVERKNEIYKIVLATAGCDGPCPLQVFSMDSSLTIKYRGIGNTDRIGYYIGKFDQSLWDTLNNKFEQLNFEKLDTLYNNSVDDLTTEIFIYHKKGVKHIVGQSGSLPSELMDIYNWLFRNLFITRMSKTTDSLKIETTILPPPPKEFTPPIIE
jgi:hypothetical protein